MQATHQPITIAISACAFQPARSTHWQSTPLQSVHVCPTSAKTTTVQCVFHLPAISVAIIACTFFFYTSEPKSLCIPSTSHHHRNQCLCVPVSAFHPPAIHPLQSAHVCPTSVPATTVHCVFHLAQSELALSISTPVNQNRLCSPRNRQPHRYQCLWIPWCAFHYVLPFCSFCLLGNHTSATSACVSYILVSNHRPLSSPPAGYLRCNQRLCFLFLQQ